MYIPLLLLLLRWQQTAVSTQNPSSEAPVLVPGVSGSFYKLPSGHCPLMVMHATPPAAREHWPQSWGLYEAQRWDAVSVPSLKFLHSCSLRKKQWDTVWVCVWEKDKMHFHSKLLFLLCGFSDLKSFPSECPCKFQHGEFVLGFQTSGIYFSFLCKWKINYFISWNGTGTLHPV